MASLRVGKMWGLESQTPTSRPRTNPPSPHPPPIARSPNSVSSTKINGCWKLSLYTSGQSDTSLSVTSSEAVRWNRTKSPCSTLCKSLASLGLIHKTRVLQLLISCSKVLGHLTLLDGRAQLSMQPLPAGAFVPPLYRKAGKAAQVHNHKLTDLIPKCHWPLRAHPQTTMGWNMENPTVSQHRHPAMHTCLSLQTDKEQPGIRA